MSEVPSLDHGDNIRRLLTLGRMLDEAARELAVADEEAVKAKQAYEVAYARQFLGAEGSMDIRRYASVVATETEKLALELADLKVRSCKERLRVLGQQADLARSLNASSTAVARL